MLSALSKRAYEPSLPALRLEALWYVEADESYAVSKRSLSSQSYVAVRTLTGKGAMRLSGGRTLSLLPNTIAVIEEAKIRHYATDGAHWQFYWFEFGAEGWSPGPLSRTVQLPLSAKERAELERCFISLNSADAASCSLAENLFSYLLADWRLRAKNDPDRPDILSLLEKGRRERMTIGQIAKSAGMCERSFRDAVLGATGLSPKSYMIQGEMNAAMELLRTTGMTVAEIASCLDYASPAYFSRAFKRHFGVSPQQMREGISL